MLTFLCFHGYEGDRKNMTWYLQVLNKNYIDNKDKHD